MEAEKAGDQLLYELLKWRLEQALLAADELWWRGFWEVFAAQPEVAGSPATPAQARR